MDIVYRWQTQTYRVRGEAHRQAVRCDEYFRPHSSDVFVGTWIAENPQFSRVAFLRDRNTLIVQLTEDDQLRIAERAIDKIQEADITLSAADFRPAVENLEEIRFMPPEGEELVVSVVERGRTLPGGPRLAGELRQFRSTREATLPPNGP